MIKGSGKDAGALAIAKKVNLATESNQLSAKITTFHLNIKDLEQSKSTEYDHAVLKDAYAQKTLADTLLAEYRTMQLDRGTEEATKVLLQTQKRFTHRQFQRCRTNPDATACRKKAGDSNDATAD